MDERGSRRSVCAIHASTKEIMFAVLISDCRRRRDVSRCPPPRRSLPGKSRILHRVVQGLHRDTECRPMQNLIVQSARGMRISTRLPHHLVLHSFAARALAECTDSDTTDQEWMKTREGFDCASRGGAPSDCSWNQGAPAGDHRLAGPKRCRHSPILPTWGSRLRFSIIFLFFPFFVRSTTTTTRATPALAQPPVDQNEEGAGRTAYRSPLLPCETTNTLTWLGLALRI